VNDEVVAASYTKLLENVVDVNFDSAKAHHGSPDVLKVDHDSSGAHAGAICLERQITNIRYRD
jgi:hypothetical protein